MDQCLNKLIQDLAENLERDKRVVRTNCIHETYGFYSKDSKKPENAYVKTTIRRMHTPDPALSL